MAEWKLEPKNGGLRGDHKTAPRGRTKTNAKKAIHHGATEGHRGKAGTQSDQLKAVHHRATDGHRGKIQVCVDPGPASGRWAPSRLRDSSCPRGSCGCSDLTNRKEHERVWPPPPRSSNRVDRERSGFDALCRLRGTLRPGFSGPDRASIQGQWTAGTGDHGGLPIRSCIRFLAFDDYLACAECRLKVPGRSCSSMWCLIEAVVNISNTNHVMYILCGPLWLCGEHLRI